MLHLGVQLHREEGSPAVEMVKQEEATKWVEVMNGGEVTQRVGAAKRALLGSNSSPVWDRPGRCRVYSPHSLCMEKHRSRPRTTGWH